MAKKFFDIKKSKKSKDLRVKEVKPKRGKEVEIEPSGDKTGPEMKLEERYNEFLKSLSSKTEPETEIQPEKKKKRAKPKDRSRVLKSVSWLIGLIGLGLLIYFGSGFISQVEIVLEIQKETQEKTFSALFEKEPEQTGFLNGQFVLPLHTFEKSFSYSKDYPATGEGEVSGYSRGKIIIYNEATQSAQILVARTRFESPDGKIFRIQERVSVPGYDRVGPGILEVEVVADQPGPEYNLESTRFTIPGFAGSSKFEKIYAISKEKFYGGASGLAKVVTEEDVKTAKEKITQFAYDTAREEVIKEIPENLKLLDKAVQFKLGEIAVSSAGEAEITRATIEGRLSILVFDETELKELIAEKMVEDQQIKSDLTLANYQIFYENPEIDLETQTMKLAVRVRRDIQALVDALEFKQKIAGKSIEELKKELLKLEGVQKIQVSVWPFWMKKAPENIDAIKIRVE
ncbi:MAG: hypothetical protein AB1721_00755 [Patescibacteria group bacterium]